MFDITLLESSFGQNYYCTIFYTILLFVGYLYNMSYVSRQKNSQPISLFLILGVFVYCLTSFTNGDYFHYYEYIKGLNRINPEQGLEPIYQHLILFINNNYLLFRVLVWGSALILYVKTLERLEINIGHAVFFLIACYLNTFSYARATLGMAIFFYGYSIFYSKHDKTVVNKIIGVLLLVISMYFHRSMSIMIALWLISLIIPLNKQSIILLLCIFPFVAFIGKNLFGHTLEMGYIQNEIILRKLEGYNDRIAQGANWKGILQMLLQYSTYYVPLYVSSKILLNKNIANIEYRYVHLAKLVFMTIYVATLFLFIIPNNQVFFYRILFMAMIPITILITYLLDNGLLELKYFKYAVYLGILYSYQFYLYKILLEL